MSNRTVLVVEDDKRILNLISVTLKAHDYKCITAMNGETAILMTTSYNPDIILLNLGLPDGDGNEIIKKIRSWSETPIIVISSRNTDSDKVMALDNGADDYVTKPFSIEELLARIRVMERRFLASKTIKNESSVFQNGDLTIDYGSGCVYVKSREIHLTPTEYNVLCMLSRNIGKVLTHTAITKEIWGNTWSNNVMSLRVCVAALRKKIETDENSPQYIQTHTRVGYRMIKVD